MDNLELNRDIVWALALVGLVLLVAFVRRVARGGRIVPAAAEPDPALEMIKGRAIKDMPEYQTLLEDTRPAVLLNPQRAPTPLPLAASKFGGMPYPAGLEAWPRCEACRMPMNFILQITRGDFSEFFFPDGKDLFQLFECPNWDCPAAHERDADQKLAWFYRAADAQINVAIARPDLPRKNMDAARPECLLRPVRFMDHPKAYYGYWHDYYRSEDLAAWKIIRELYGPRAVDAIAEALPGARERTKVGGFPSWIQEPAYPQCRCGRVMELILQFSQLDDCEQPRRKGTRRSTLDVPATLGGAGNTYFFVCRACGVESMETRWDMD
jgi:hypothetical protein